MSRVVVAMNSFKGSLGASEACQAACRGILEARPDLAPVPCPIADGGDGTLSVLSTALNGVRVRSEVHGPLGGRRVAAEWLWIPPATTHAPPSAVIEMASASGLTLVPHHDRDPMRATSRGTGELIVAAVDRGVRRITLGLGGSATVDGGVGAARALGWRFLSERGAEIPEGGRGLARLATIVPPDQDRLSHVDLRILLDVDTPLCGPAGAAPVFGPQKGADREDVDALAEGLDRLAERIQADLGLDVRMLPGGGAAGGLGAAAVALFGGTPESGASFVLDTIGFDEVAAGAFRIVTGEGRFDRSSLRGKSVAEVARRGEAASVPVSVLAGAVDPNVDVASLAGIDEVFPVTPAHLPLDAALARASALLEAAARRMAGDWPRGSDEDGPLPGRLSR